MALRSLDTIVEGSSWVGSVKKSPGRRSVVPYTISAPEHDKVFFKCGSYSQEYNGKFVDPVTIG